MSTPRKAISYQLVIRVARAVTVRVGALGQVRFAPGRYIYTGSAKRAIEARVARHLAGARRLHWHIDHLLAAPGVRVTATRLSPRPECSLNQATAGSIPVPRFGASDCRAGCGSHLKYQGRH
ncbi:MAG TPA: DUF123 domain-containing protein [Rhodocyclaceae bacterium]|nr:MAG: hypothetical protein AUK49_00075 [Betaproteobacteria bacterium CG2_30_68_42]PIV72315.1 MAG: DUF123 domain-containing protein [Rhodocyclales bacterium CG17_big_fil_post_rev_8_21_14_2_50_68_7]PIX76039.1 MAG: DUF123 domain-containing protein [Rhodocyclales bacterium CG_4_10_14_3_um_filter_68_10]PJA58594.1 MAG: DUF123 domain-containing protein [Rhodocyclales bacterium CG_4_9_14_3_um_filter_68_10]HCX34218.1 DUF123 domain-containing protein [Rhodocyclaceae bacterium]